MKRSFGISWRQDPFRYEYEREFNFELRRAAFGEYQAAAILFKSATRNIRSREGSP
jgi:hypothetical protein